MKRRTLLATAAASGAVAALPAAAQTVVGVTATEIKIGHTIAYSGNASGYGVIGKFHAAYWKMINDQGGVNGRKINFISYDDAYSPPKTVEQIRRLVEQDEVACLFNTLGTPTNSAIQKYVNQKKVPHLFVSSGADKWADPKNYPWTIGFQPSYRVEAQIYAAYIKKNKPGAKVGVLYQNDDFGKDYLLGLQDGFGKDFDKWVVKAQTYEPTDATIDSQALTLHGAGADTLVTIAIPKFAAQMIRKVFDLSWKPLHLMTNVAISVGAVMQPAGPEKSIGLISSTYLKDVTDPQWKADKGMLEWRAFMTKNYPEGDQLDASNAFAYNAVLTMHQVLKQCGNDLSRESIMRQAANLKNLELPLSLPGILVNTSPTNFHPYAQLQLQRWTGSTWALFGEIISSAPS